MSRIPENTKDGESAPGPLTRRQRMAPMNIDSGKLTAEDRRMLNPVLEPVPGKEKPKKYASGGFTRSADGCAKKGKTRGKMV